MSIGSIITLTLHLFLGITAPSDGGATPLVAFTGEIHELVSQGDTEAVRALLADDPSLLEARDALGRTPLHLAAIGEHVDITRLLLEAGAEVDPRENRQRTPFWHAAWQNDGTGVLSLLAEWGADVDAVGFLNRSPLEQALHNGNESVVDFVLESGATLPTDTRERFNLMYEAASTGSSRVFDMMFEILPTLDPTGGDATSFLWAAVEGGSGVILEQLLATGIDPNAPDIYGGLPIHNTSRDGFAAATEALVAHGADMDPRNATGDSPYNLAVSNGHATLAERLIQLGADSSPPQPPVLLGDYLGEAPPGAAPRTFAPGLISRAGSESVHATTVFSRDGNEVYWSDRWQAPISSMKRVDGRWTMPAHVPFTTGYIDDIPMLSPDERRLYFLSSMPIDDRPATNEEFLWYVERESRDHEWSDPIPGPAEINAVPLHWQFAIAPNGDFYLPTTTDNSQGRDIHISRIVDGVYQVVEPLEGPVNTPGDEHMPFVAPDDSYMVFSARNRPGGPANFSLYISFRGADGSFQEPILLPEAINEGGHRICPVVTPDGKYLFYLVGTEVHWVSTDFVDGLRP